MIFNSAMFYHLAKTTFVVGLTHLFRAPPRFVFIFELLSNFKFWVQFESGLTMLTSHISDQRDKRQYVFLKLYYKKLIYSYLVRFGVQSWQRSAHQTRDSNFYCAISEYVLFMLHLSNAVSPISQLLICLIPFLITRRIHY